MTLKMENFFSKDGITLTKKVCKKTNKQTLLASARTNTLYLIVQCSFAKSVQCQADICLAQRIIHGANYVKRGPMRDLCARGQVK